MSSSSIVEQVNSPALFLPATHPPIPVNSTTISHPAANIVPSYSVSDVPANQATQSKSTKHDKSGEEAFAIEKFEEIGEGSKVIVDRELRYIWITAPSTVSHPAPLLEKQRADHQNSGNTQNEGMKVGSLDGQDQDLDIGLQQELTDSGRQGEDIGKGMPILSLGGGMEKEVARAVLEVVAVEEGGKEGEPMSITEPALSLPTITTEHDLISTTAEIIQPFDHPIPAIISDIFTPDPSTPSDQPDQLSTSTADITTPVPNVSKSPRSQMTMSIPTFVQLAPSLASTISIDDSIGAVSTDITDVPITSITDVPNFPPQEHIVADRQLVEGPESKIISTSSAIPNIASASTDQIVESDMEKEEKEAVKEEEEEEKDELPAPIIPRPTFSKFVLPAPVLSTSSLKRKLNPDDIFASVMPVKRKRVELQPKMVKEIEYQAIVESEPVNVFDIDNQAVFYEGDITIEEKEGEEATSMVVHVDDLSESESRPASPTSPRSESPEEAQRGQWRVGRLPGHQGSHIRRPEPEGEDMSPESSLKKGQKRCLGQNISDSAEKVLKKPFRLPARVNLKSIIKTEVRSSSPATDSHSPPSTLNPNSESDLSPIKSTGSIHKLAPVKLNTRPFAIPRKVDKPSSSPPSTTSTIISNTPLTPTIIPDVHSTKPTFKPSPTYSKRLSKPFKTPFTRSLAPSPASSRSAARTTREQILELEKEERTLRNAIKYHTQPEEDERLVELINIWKSAGREVSELLFGIQAKPDSTGNSGGGGGGLISMFGSSGSGTSRDDSFFAPPENDYTPEQIRMLARLPTDLNGKLVDDEGNLIFGGGAERGGTDVVAGDERDDRVEMISEEWTIGTMLAKMGVDPEMYAWDADAEDWGQPRDD